MVKKTFKNNPTLQFISQVEKEILEETPITPNTPNSYKKNPLYIETKSRRLQLVLQPSLFDKVKQEAQKNRLSVNEYIHRILENATKEK